ncbi:hypothetical protein Misp01_53390 [Microtetraspora sp. NBRC 13810]|uniref:transposase n=1 Tax=Microtetraspora sp. NBRC 13810 TaxID=3030990 RepID=UPI002552D049|nr:transposase [Microtetraspora sp. NBRC 13810]GLW10211.1 hypothetical protein Misp01_53390 [Microtetraspora sp. NBRC 13810]
MAVWAGANGYEVEIVVLDRRRVARVSRRIGTRKALVGYCRTVAEIAELVDLADLVEVIELPAR